MGIWLALLIMIVSIGFGGLLTLIIGKAQQVHLLHKLRDMVLDREHVSISEEFLMTKLLAEEIQKADYLPDIIFAICPGGAMIAEWLSRRFLGSFFAPIPTQLLYIIQERKKAGINTNMARVDDKLIAIPSGLPKDSKVLLVNDISRSGNTLKAAYEFLTKHFPAKNICSATLICHKDASAKPKYHVAETKKTIRFDWKNYD